MTPQPSTPLAPVAQAAPTRSGRFLEPIDRVSELLFGLIMVLTFTGSLSVATAGRDEVRTMLIGAMGCNLAWGVIDAIFYLMGAAAERAGGLLKVRAVRAAKDADEARRMLAGALPPMIATLLEPAELEALRLRICQLPELPARARLRRDDWLGAAAVFLWVFVATFPVVIPFIVVREPMLALRASNGVAIAMLFMAGFVYGRCVGRPPLLTGGATLLLGAALVAMTIALGG